MENKLTKKYGLLTAICMVVGIVIGSGVFFKAPSILIMTGSLSSGIWAWIIGGAIMLFCVYTFSVMAGKYEKVNGIVDYAEATVGSRYCYFIGWFMVCLYYPVLTGALAYVSAIYIAMLFNAVNASVILPLTIFLSVSFTSLNMLAPILAGKIQVSTTIIKLIPLFLMAVVGTLYGAANGNLAHNFADTVETGASSGFASLLSGVCATAFAYEGWIIATSINAEIKNAKKNLPRALVIGSIIVVCAYMFYFIGIGGGSANLQSLTDKSGVSEAYSTIFGKTAGKILTVFVAVSCLGTLNGLSLGNSRGIYSLAIRGSGPAPEFFKKLDSRCNMSFPSCIFGGILALVVAIYYFYFDFEGKTGFFMFDISELPIVTIYVMYIPIFINFIKKADNASFMNRYIMPTLAILGSIFMASAAVVKYYNRGLIGYLIVFAIIMIIGTTFFKNRKRLQ